MSVRDDRYSGDNLAPSRPLDLRPEHLPASTGPQQPSEQDLVRLWQEELDFAPIGIDDSYFEIGGDSVSALNIFLALEESFGIKLGPSVLVEHPTIRALAKLIGESGRDAPHPAVVVFNDGGSRPPLYFVHGRNGEVIFVRPIADLLDSDQPVFALRYPRDHETWPRPATIEGIAAAYAGLLRTRHGDGPFHLGGYSLGAVLALEMAHQVKMQGGVIDSLTMVDPAIPPGTHRRRLLYHARDLLQQPPGEAIFLLTHRLRTYLARAIQNLEGRMTNADPGNSEDATERALLRLRLELTSALKAYRPKPYDGPVTVVSSGELRRVYREPTLGWAEIFTGPIETIEMSGTHHSIIRDPLVRELAALLAERLRAHTES